MTDQNSNKPSIHVFDAPVKMSKYTPVDIKASYSGQETFNGGTNNQNYINYRNLYHDSPTHNSIINAFVNFGYGAGLKVINVENIYQYIDKQDIRQTLFDLKTFGGYSLLVYWKDGKPLRFSYIDFEKVAVKVKRGTLDHESYVFSYDWSNTSLYPKKYYKKFTGKYNGNKIELLYVRNSTKNIFAIPDYISAIPWATVESELSNGAKNFLLNSMTPTTIVNVNSGRLDDDKEAEKEADRIRKQVGGSENLGRTIVNFTQGAEYATTIDRLLPPDLNQQNVFFTEEAERSIIKGHSAHPLLFSGTQTTAGFGNNAGEKEQALQEMYRKNINPLRELYIDGLEPAFKLIDPTFRLEFEDFDKVEEIEMESNPIDEKTLEAQAQLKGSVGGVQSLLEVQASYSAGTTSYESAIAILDLIFGFTRDQAVRLLGNPETKTP